MIIPRRLYRTADGQWCEEDDVRQAYVAGVPGETVPDAVAERNGLKAYLEATGLGPQAHMPEPVESKTVAQHEVEDKAVSGPEEAKTPDASEPEEPADPGPGLHIDPALRTGRRRG